jgi:hypothetical protein
MNKGFVTFSDQKYLPLLEVLLDGLDTISAYPVEVFTTGFTLKNRWSKVRAYRVHTKFTSIFQLKIYAASRSSFDYAVMLDADSVPNLNADKLIEAAELFERPYPLMTKHGCPPQNWHALMKRLGVKTETLPYGQATFLFSKSSRPFMTECDRIFTKLMEEEHWPPNWDETLLNVMLWRANASAQVNAFNCFEGVSTSYFEGELPDFYKIYYASAALSYHIFHGQKDATKARELLERVKGQDPNNPRTRELLSIPVQLL